MDRLSLCGFCLCGFFAAEGFAQTIPVFGPEIPVTIQGLTFDAMEPALSADSKYLFFNSVNDGIATSLFYAARLDDSIFVFKGALAGANQTVTPRLDAVASADSSGNFYWTSLRRIPASYETCFRGKFNGSDVVKTGSLFGDFYVNIPGWVMMDASIDLSGDQLFYTNAYFGPTFTGCNGVPCKTNMGIALRVNDSTFNKKPGADTLFSVINDTSYASYAPHLTADGLELYFTRFKRSDISMGTQICVSVRSATDQPFGVSKIIHDFSPLLPEAACLTADGNKLYYHKKRGSLFGLYLRYRGTGTGIPAYSQVQSISVFPNPSTGMVFIETQESGLFFQAELFSCLGEQLIVTGNRSFDISKFNDGVYYIRIVSGEKVWVKRIVKSASS